MSKKILIIGNGFDLAHGLPTNYSDFLAFSHEFMKLYDVAGDKNGEEKINYKLNGYLETALSDLRSQRHLIDDAISEVHLNDGILNQMYDDLKDNIWFQYFTLLLSQNLLKGDNWIDFESEISYVIQQIDQNTDNLSEDFLNVDSRFVVNKVNKMLTFDKAVDGVHKHEFLRRTSVSKFAEELFKDLTRLTEALEIYLSYFVEGQILPMVQEAHKTLLKIQDLNPDYVLSFNYTHTFQRLYDKDGKAQYCYIHGECREIDPTKQLFEGKRESNLVLGIDEFLEGDDRDRNNRFAIFKKFVQRIRNHNDTSYRDWISSFAQKYDENAKLKDRLINKNAIDNAPYDVYTYGHSLDITDEDVLNLFMKPEWACIHVFAYNKMSEGSLIENLIKIIGEKSVIDKASSNPPMLEIWRSPLEENN